ncbi:MAG: MliC family protein [Deltaproteobacteria bacterium]|nr:MliC family protein [Deltaproteobacteria bacterium]
MFRSIRGAFLISISVVSLCACFGNPQNKVLTVDIGSPVYYENKNGDHFEAKHGSLSDGTLHFVKVKMPDGQEYTLPQAVSGSGARYTDDKEIVWWEHQGTVRVDVRDSEGKWKTKYSGLKEVSGK